MGRSRDGVVPGSHVLQHRVSETPYVRRGERVELRKGGLAPLRQGGEGIMVLGAILLPELTEYFPVSGGGLGEGVGGHLRLRRLKLHGNKHKMHPIWTMQKKSFSQALFFENRILVRRKYFSYHLCHFVPFFGQPKTKKMDKSYDFSGK